MRLALGIPLCVCFSTAPKNGVLQTRLIMPVLHNLLFFLNILSSHLLLKCIVFAKLENVHFLKGMEVLFLGPALLVGSVVSGRY